MAKKGGKLRMTSDKSDVKAKQEFKGSSGHTVKNLKKRPHQKTEFGGGQYKPGNSEY